MKLRYLVAPLVFGVSSMAIAANNGTLGATSTGDTDVSITIADVVQVGVQGDLPLTYAPGVASTATTGVCIYRNSDADVDVTLTSANPDGSNNFQMNDGGTNDILYSVTLGGVGYTSSVTDTISDEDNSSSNCSGGFSHTLGVSAAAVDLDAAPAGSYDDTITILVAPN